MCTSATTTDERQAPSPTVGTHRGTRALAGLLLGATLLSLSGCYVGVGYTWTDDDPPSVSLAVSPSSAPPGSTLTLAAAASDDDYVERVDFYRMSGGGAAYLGSDHGSPYALTTVLPETTASSVSYFARAVDSWGQTTDSEWVSVTVLR
ncbi:Ig-like domain-containing protein [Sphaerotilus microaerophilus]|uniref:Fibronectin type-III domain-containing protein n=1 Tax=Sphaerotilus microaerophilus TaxID=2914710 RepID=A0ABN6PH51_9BURK|nr:Ig-like domain-containing protein [Sphaerotilus sp. FB-5]BDI04268.1 hypothetical protein CATMQ487_12380 [Sphaerotilus sp. FB-5]